MRIYFIFEIIFKLNENSIIFTPFNCIKLLNKFCCFEMIRNLSTKSRHKRERKKKVLFLTSKCILSYLILKSKLSSHITWQVFKSERIRRSFINCFMFFSFVFFFSVAFFWYVRLNRSRSWHSRLERPKTIGLSQAEHKCVGVNI